jgi:hypothetical protein
MKMLIRRFGMLVLGVICLLFLSVSSIQARPQPVDGPLPFIGPELAISDWVGDEHFPAVAYNWNDHEFLVVNDLELNDGSFDITGAILSSNGATSQWFNLTFSLDGDNRYPDVTYDPTNERYLVVWMNNASGNWDVFGRFIPAEGLDFSLTSFPINDGGGDQWLPRVAFGQGNQKFLVVWNDDRPASPRQVSGQFVPGSGRYFTPGGFTIASDPSEDRLNADIVYNQAHDEYLVVWETVEPSDQDDIWAVRMRADGTPLGGGEFAVAGWPDSEEQPRVAVCPAADQYFVVWQSDQGGGNYDVYGRMIAGDGTRTNIIPHLFYTAAPQQNPVVTCSFEKDEYLVVWEHQTIDSGEPRSIWAQRVQADGRKNKPLSLGAGVSFPWQEAQHPAVAGSSPQYLVIWEQDVNRQPGTEKDIHGRLYSAQAIFLPFVKR